MSGASRDGISDLLRGLAGGDRHVVVVNLARNFGLQGALTAGVVLGSIGEYAGRLYMEAKRRPAPVPEEA